MSYHSVMEVTTRPPCHNSLSGRQDPNPQYYQHLASIQKTHPGVRTIASACCVLPVKGRIKMLNMHKYL